MPRWADEYEDESDWQEDWDSDDDGDDAMPCPSCGADVYADAPRCPSCGDYIVESSEFDEHQPQGPHGVWADRPAWWIWLGVLGIIATILALV